MQYVTLYAMLCNHRFLGGGEGGSLPLARFERLDHMIKRIRSYNWCWPRDRLEDKIPGELTVPVLQNLIWVII